VVELDGDVARSSGGVTATRVGLSQYRVDFGTNVSNCMYLATIADPGSALGEHGVARPRRYSLDPEVVSVETVGDIDGFGDDPHIVAKDMPFHIAVFC
jgi:hypothetical protein